MKYSDTLFELIKTHKVDEFIEYLSTIDADSFDINTRDASGNYLIFFAILFNRLNAIKKILERGARIDLYDVNGYCMLYYPIHLNYYETLETLIDYDDNSIGLSAINMKDVYGNNVLQYAISANNHAALKILLKHNVDVTNTSSTGENALHRSIMKKDIIMCKMIIKHFTQVNDRTIIGDTPLHLACNYQLNDIVRLLLKKGANTYLYNNIGYCPVFYSVVENNLELVKLNSEYGINMHHQDVLGNTALHYALIFENLEIIDFFFTQYKIQQNSNNDIFTENINDYDITNTRNLNVENIDPDIINIEGLTIMHIIMYNYEEYYDKYILQLLPLSNLNYQDNNGYTILHIMAEKKIIHKFESILRVKKMNIFIVNNENNTVFDMIPLMQRESFLNIVIDSYFYYLRKYRDALTEEWQNKCILHDTQQIPCYEQIRNDIIKNKISIPNKKNRRTITIDIDNQVHYNTFTGSQIDLISGFKYLTKKYPNVASLFFKDSHNYISYHNYYEDSSQHILHLEIMWIFQKIFFPTNFHQHMSSLILSGRYDYIIIPIGIILSNANHVNCLIYDINNATLERFEPHGSGFPFEFNYNPNLLDKQIHAYFNNLLSDISKKNIKIKYIRPENYLPKIGFQTFENMEASINTNIGDPNGFCALWCIWYIDQRMKNINVSPLKLVKRLTTNIRMNNYLFRNIIRNYSGKITKLRDIYLEKIDKNINDYLNKKLTDKEREILADYIINDQ